MDDDEALLEKARKVAAYGPSFTFPFPKGSEEEPVYLRSESIGAVTVDHAIEWAVACADRVKQYDENLACEVFVTMSDMNLEDLSMARKIPTEAIVVGQQRSASIAMSKRVRNEILERQDADVL